MSNRKSAFTLAEILVVLAIIVVLAGMMFPVFVSVKSAAQKTACISNFKQVHEASMLYLGDYSDVFMPVNHLPGQTPDAMLDRTWVQLVLPYSRTLSVFRCPSDPTIHPEPKPFDPDVVPDDTTVQYYLASKRVNMGYNYMYLAPIVKMPNGWMAIPKSAALVGDPSRTLMFLDSVWDRTAAGVPTGGGNYLVVPPCRYETDNGKIRDTFLSSIGTGFTIFFQAAGWEVTNSNSGTLYGGAWPWHSGRINVARVDGSVKSIAPSELTSGCNVLDHWLGRITDPGVYMWDTN